MLDLLLARYGLSDESLLCIDAKPSTLKSGQADGIQPRTLEVFKTLGISDEIENEACHMWQFAFWNPSPDKKRIIERTAVMPEVIPPARFKYEATIHQGRIERIMETDLLRYSKRGVLRNTQLVDVKIDENGDSDFPVVVTMKTNGTERTVRTKYLVGADGAHSVVRQSLGLKLEGESLDHIWGVVDLVADTNFPDIRRRCGIHSPAGSVMVIPRERISTGEYLTRLYVHVPDIVPPEDDQLPAGETGSKADDARQRRSKITLEGILKQAADAMQPYYIRPKDGVIDWWAAYQIGQRVLPEFIVKDSKNAARVFVVGDACHTHSPKAGQGMNVSMMDSYNLAWKLIYQINGLAPPSTSDNPTPLLNTYQTERHETAQQLIDFDRKFSTMFSGQMGATEGLTQEEFQQAFKLNNGFTSGCGVEYPENILVVRDMNPSSSPVRGTDYLSGILRPGRRLLNVKLVRHADGGQRDLHDDTPSTARFRVLCLASQDLLDRDSVSAKALERTAMLVTKFPASTIEQIVLHPRLHRTFEWGDIPACVKQTSEMRLYDGAALDDAYSIYGVDPAHGALAVIRPDGYVGVVAQLDDLKQVEEYLQACIRTVS
ncbi:unnamed protein product [Penicillium pancosmium]